MKMKRIRIVRRVSHDMKVGDIVWVPLRVANDLVGERYAVPCNSSIHDYDIR
jgi:hypothetical protein